MSLGNLFHFKSSDKKDLQKKYVCKKCGKEFTYSELEKVYMICPECGAYFRVPARQRIAMVTDAGSFKELYADVKAKDFLSFPGYGDKLKAAAEASGETEGVTCGTASIGGVKCAVFAMNSEFMMGSMGCAVGEKITRIFELATKKKLPVVGFTTSGGARMQEGIISLMQMAKVSGAVKKHNDEGLLYLCVLTDPTTGGVTASFAMEGDITIAEPNALIGFAGARVIQQTTGQELPPSFQRSEFLLSHGFVDMISKRENLKDDIANILDIHTRESR